MEKVWTVFKETASVNGELCLHHVVPGRCCSVVLLGCLCCCFFFISLFFYCKQLSAVAEQDGGSERLAKAVANPAKFVTFSLCDLRQ